MTNPLRFLIALTTATTLFIFGIHNEVLAQGVSVLVAYHSGTGNTEKIAQGVAEGARSVSGATVNLKRVGDVSADDLLASDAVILGSPVYFGNMAGEVKTF